LAEKLKVNKELSNDDPVIVTLQNILMVAPKQDQHKSELNIAEQLKDEEEQALQEQEEEAEKPMFYRDFKEKF